jgi:TatD DNase family protein
MFFNMTAELIDTHAHLTYDPLAGEIDQVLARASASGVRKIITVATSPDDLAGALALADAHEWIYCAVGIHPHHADEYSTLEALKNINHPKLLAIGETGLDFHYTFADRANQEKLFLAHIELAEEKNLPLIVHCREAFPQIMEILTSMNRPFRGVFHCFSGGVDEARKVLDLGFLVSFSGTVTFKSTHDLRKAAAFVGCDNILTETDCPYLSPEPVRKNKTNEPANVLYIATKLASVLNQSLDDFAQHVMTNARKVFGKI